MNLLSPDTVLFALAMHRGAANGVHARELVRGICGETSSALERQLRDVIVVLRSRGEHLCGTPESGYYMADSEAELLTTTRFLYDRAMTSLSQVAAMRRVSLPDLRGQLRLPT